MLFKQKKMLTILLTSSAIVLVMLLNGCSDEQHTTKHSTAISQTTGSTKSNALMGNTAPIAHLGDDQVVRVGQIVTLDGSQSNDPDQDTMTFVWKQASGPAVNIINSHTLTPSFIAPATKQALSFSLTINDGKIDSDIATVIINVSNRAPMANAGRTIVAKRGDNVMLDGSSSIDPDKDGLKYNWTQTYGEKVTLSNNTKISPSFTMPALSGYLIFSLSVNDGTDDSIIDTVAVKVDNTAPVAVITPITDNIIAGQMVSLDGRKSTDADGDTLAYHWGQVLGSPVALQSADTATAQFIAPGRPDHLVFELTVFDGEMSSHTESLIVSVKNKAKPAEPTIDIHQLVSVVDMSLTTTKKTAVTLPVASAPSPVDNFLPEVTEGFTPAPVFNSQGKPTHGSTDKQLQKTEWGYEGESAPSHWSSLDNNFELCGNGTQQSPIDILTPGMEFTPQAIEFHYATSTIDIVNNGHTIQVNYDEGSYATINGKRYDLLQFHFHSPSEHTIDGEHADMAAHMLHKADDGSLAVVAVLFKEGEENEFLRAIWANLPLEAGMRTESPSTIFAANMLPEIRSYYHYTGSLTTPPCSEDVNWNIMTTIVNASASQIEAFTSIFAKSVRPTQTLHDRKVIIK